MAALATIPESPRPLAGITLTRNEADTDSDKQTSVDQDLGPNPYQVETSTDGDVAVPVESKRLETDKENINDLLQFSLQRRPQTSGSDVADGFPFEQMRLSDAYMDAAKVKTKGRDHVQDAALLKQRTIPKRGHDREIVTPLSRDHQLHLSDVQHAPPRPLRQLSPPFGHALDSRGSSESKKQKKRKKISQNAGHSMTEPGFSTNVNQKFPPMTELELPPTASTSVIGTGTGSLSAYTPVLPKGNHTTVEDTMLHVHEKQNPTASNVGASGAINMRGNSIHDAVGEPEQNHQAHRVQSMPETVAQRNSTGVEVTRQMPHHKADSGPGYQAPHNQHHIEKVDPATTVIASQKADSSHMDGSNMPMRRRSTVEMVENGGQLVHKPHKQCQSKSRPSRASQNVPSIPEVLTVLGFAITSQLGQTEHARMTRDAETIDLKATIAKLGLQVAQLEEQRAANVEKEKAYTKQVQDYKAKAQKFLKFLTGINNDIQRERATGKELREVIKNIQAETEPSLSEYWSVSGEAKRAAAGFETLKKKTFEQLRAAQGQSRQLENEKAQLESQIQLQAQELRSLTHERDQIKSQLEQRSETSARLDDLLNTNRDVLLDKLAELAATFGGDRDPSASEEIKELANKIQELSKVSPDATDGFRQSMTELESRIIGRMDGLQDTVALSAQDHADPSESIEQQIREHLSQIKDEFSAWQASQERFSALREDKAALTEQLKFQEQKVTELSRRIEMGEQQQDVLLKHNTQLLQQVQLRTLDRGSERASQELADLKTEFEKVQSTLAEKNHELEELRVELNTAKLKCEEEIKDTRRKFTEDAIRSRKDVEAKYENKFRSLQIKHEKTQQDQSSVGVAGRPGARRVGLFHGSNQASHDDYESRILALQKDHEAKQLSMRNEHQATLTQLKRDHEANVADQVKAVEKVAEARIQDAERNHNEAQMLEKQELEGRISSAEMEKDSAIQQLEEANRVADEWKEKFELLQAELNKPPTTLHNQDDEEPDHLDGEHASKQGSLHGMPNKAGCRTHGQPSRIEVHRTQKVPVSFGEQSSAQRPTRSVNRAKAVRSQSADSMLFQDESDEEESHEQQEEEIPQELLPSPAKGYRSAPPAVDRSPSKAQHKGYIEHDLLSSPLSSDKLNQLEAEGVTGSRSDEPRANSSQRMVPSTNPKSRHEKESKMTSAKEAENDGITRVLRPRKAVNAAILKSALAGTPTAQTARKKSGDPSKVLVRNSQDESRKRTSSPFDQSNAGKRKRLDPSLFRSGQGRANAFTQHNDIQRTKSRDGILVPSSRPGTGASLAPSASPAKRINSRISTRATSISKGAKAIQRVGTPLKKGQKKKG